MTKEQLKQTYNFVNKYGKNIGGELFYEIILNNQSKAIYDEVYRFDNGMYFIFNVEYSGYSIFGSHPAKILEVKVVK